MLIVDDLFISGSDYAKLKNGRRCSSLISAGEMGASPTLNSEFSNFTVGFFLLAWVFCHPGIP